MQALWWPRPTCWRRVTSRFVCLWPALNNSPGKFLILRLHIRLELVQGEIEPETDQQSPSEGGRLVIGPVNGIQYNGIASAFEWDSAVDFRAIKLLEGMDVFFESAQEPAFRPDAWDVFLQLVLLSPPVILNEGLTAFSPISQTEDSAWPFVVFVPVRLCAQILGELNGRKLPNPELSRVLHDVSGQPAKLERFSSWHRYSTPMWTHEEAQRFLQTLCFSTGSDILS